MARHGALFSRAVIAVLLCVTGYVSAAEFHVSTGGDDAQPGTAAEPFHTLRTAAAIAKAGDVVVVHAGVYRETLTVCRSGTKAQPIVFRAAAGEQLAIWGERAGDFGDKVVVM